MQITLFNKGWGKNQYPIGKTLQSMLQNLIIG